MRSDQAQPAGSERCSRSLLRRLIEDESGGEIIEYALVLGLVIVATIVVIANFGTKVMARWTSVNASM